jgi:hypothetical protein
MLMMLVDWMEVYILQSVHTAECIYCRAYIM